MRLETLLTVEPADRAGNKSLCTVYTSLLASLRSTIAPDYRSPYMRPLQKLEAEQLRGSNKGLWTFKGRTERILG